VTSRRLSAWDQELRNHLALVALRLMTLRDEHAPNMRANADLSVMYRQLRA
jgi:hypothetical protein